MSDFSLRAVLTADDQASKVIQGLGNNIRNLGQALGGAMLGNALKDQFSQAVSASNQMQNALLGLGTVASASGVGMGAAQQAAKSLAADGLMSVSDAATGLKNLLRTNFGLDQAVEIMNRFKDTAAFGRQAALGFGESIVGATEGIKNQNEILLDNAGMSTNATKLIEKQGGSMKDFANISTDAGTRLKFVNGMMADTARQSGDAARLTQTFSGAQQQMATAVFNARAKIGDLLKGGLQPLVEGITDFLTKNQQMAVSLAIAAGGALSFMAAILAIGGAVRLTMAIMGGPFSIILTGLAAILGVILYGAIQRVQDKMKAAGLAFGKGGDDIQKAIDDSAKAVNKDTQKMNEQLADLAKNMSRAADDFSQSLKQIVTDHQQKVDDIKNQLADENKAFIDAQAIKEADFKTSNDKLVSDHQGKVSEIESQIKQELIAGTDANAQRINDLRVRLAQENEAYSKQLADTQVKYDQDAASAKATHEAKTSDYQKQLDIETTFLLKHNAEVASVRDVQLADEIDKLKNSYTRQQQDFAENKQKILDANKDMITQEADQIRTNSSLQAAAEEQGRKMGEGLKKFMVEEFTNGISQLWTNIKDLGSEIATYFKILWHYGGGGGSGPNSNSAKFDATWNDYLSTGNVKYRAGGGDVMAGQPYIVGEKRAELFVPETNGIIVPQVPEGGSGTVNVTINGVFMGTPADGRRLAEMVKGHLQDIAGSKNMSVAGYMG